MALLERGPVQLELSHLLHEAAAGCGHLVFLGGDAGIGKTALVRRFSTVASASGRLLTGACDPLSTPRPLAPLLDMQAQVGARCADLIAAPAERDAIFRGFLAELAGAGPTTAVFEDVHWADEATLDLLRFLGRRLEGTPALLIATYRSDEVGDRHPLRVVLGDLATVGCVRRLTLEPLSPAGVRALAAGTAVDPARLHAQTGGNPFYVTEVIASGNLGIPATVRDAVLARAARLSPEAREVLDAAAVLGFRIEPWLLETVAAAADGAIDACLGGGMLHVEGSWLVFHHELARDAILAALPPHRARALHRAALRALQAQPEGSVDLGRLAHHADGAGDGAAVLAYAPAAGRRARALSAHREAAAQLGRALRYADSLPAPERAQLWEEYSWECASTDHWDEAIRADHALIAIWRAEGDRAREGWSLSFLVGCLTAVGRLAEAEEASRESVALLESLPPGAERAEAYAIRANLRLLDRDLPGACEWAHRSLELAEALGSVRVQAMALNRLGTAGILAGDAAGEAHAKRALAMAEEAGLHWYVAGSHLNLGVAWAEVHAFARADAHLADGAAFATEHELEGMLTNVLAMQAVVQLHLGRWPEAAETAERVVQRSGSNLTGRTVALTAWGRLLARRGDSGAAERLDAALALAQPTGSLSRLAPVRAARAEAAWLAGDLERARAEAADVLELALRHRHPWFAGEMLSWLARSGEVVEAPAWIAAPFARQIAGRWTEAASEWERCGCPYEAAQARVETCVPAQLREALAAFEALGARPAAQRVQRRLRELGVRGIPRGPRPSTRTHPAGLTRREAEVAALLAEGLRNAEIARRLFLSPKTVDHHVSSVLAKLAVRTRAQVASAVLRMEEAQSGEAGVPI
jgi:DNA-binding CsgD family transcriptional regulator/tetratricopeptide (TPR) repeat protein